MLEDWLNNQEPEGGFPEIVMKREGVFQHEEQLEEDGNVPAEELA
jgi:hypothetical protein